MDIETYVTQAQKINPNITDYQIEEYYPDEHPTLHLIQDNKVIQSIQLLKDYTIPPLDAYIQLQELNQ